MRNRLTLTTVYLIVVSTGSVAFAQVEPRMAGDWRSGDEPAQLLHIGSGGRYQTTVDGRVTDSGKMTGNNGAWKLKSDSGRSDSGSFSFLSGNLMLHGGMSGSWSPTSARPATSHTPTSARSYSAPPSSPSYTPAAAEVQPDYRTPPPSSQTYSSMYGHNDQPLPGYSKPSNLPPHPFKPQAYIPGPPTRPPNISPNAPFGWQPPPDHPSDRGPHEDSNGAWVNRSPAQSAQAPARHVDAADQRPNGFEAIDFERNAAIQWQQRGISPGYQRVPRGGYIPVMKDGKARSFRRGF